MNIYKLEPEIIVEFKEELPLVTAAQLEDQKITGLLASYTTRFNSNQIGRTENVRIAAKALDMAIIKPELILSYLSIRLSVKERLKAGIKMLISLLMANSFRG
ncbi:MAG TPA: hypothetical protein VFC58_04600 [Desulfosporosinus sp.]|nr:hypothetical protein [Desulfosporosinus sp.]